MLRNLSPEAVTAMYHCAQYAHSGTWHDSHQPCSEITEIRC
jgi:hypothetical protein